MHTIHCILLVDDNHHTNFLHRKIIESLKIPAVVSVAQDGEEAAAYLQRASEGSEAHPFPDLILLDINLPRMNGWEVLEEYRQRKYGDQQRTIIIMITTSPNLDDEQKAKALPEIAGFVKKPLTKQILSGVIRQFFDENFGVVVA